jgi:peptide/nickel transport system substrate-binding protein
VTGDMMRFNAGSLIGHPGFEWDPEEAAASRRTFLSSVTNTDTLLLPIHIPSPTIGLVTADGGQFNRAKSSSVNCHTLSAGPPKRPGEKECTMRRRKLIGGIAGALATPSLASFSGAQAASRILRFVTGSGVVQLDPVATTIGPTLILGLQIFESLYSVDADLVPRPQMAAGHVIDNDGKRWTITLREGLRFHDGEPVLAGDCAASVKRWAQRDLTGSILNQRLDAIETPDDRTLIFRLRRPFQQLPFILGKASPNLMAVMPSRLAATDANQALSELVGSGPFRFTPSEFSANSRTVLERFDGYIPRNEPPSGTAGGRVAKVDRIEWNVLPDPATQVAALLTDEADWVFAPLHDLVPRLNQSQDIVVKVIDHFGMAPFVRPNHASGPTARVEIRRAIMAALDGREVIAAAVGDQPGYITSPIGIFSPSSPFETQAGMNRLGPKSPTEVRAMLRQAGYGGEKLVLLHQADVFAHDVMLQVIARRLVEAGFNVEDQRMDMSTMLKRRGARAEPGEGGWSLFFNAPSCADLMTPMQNFNIRTGSAAWFGWPQDPELEALRSRWLDATELAQQRELAARMQELALDDALYIPLGRYTSPSAWRTNLSGVLEASQPAMWNITKS